MDGNLIKRRETVQLYNWFAQLGKADLLPGWSAHLSVVKGVFYNIFLSLIEFFSEDTTVQ